MRAVARALKNTGLTELVLVAPAAFDADEARRLVQLGVHGIITDRPQFMRQILN